MLILKRQFTAFSLATLILISLIAPFSGHASHASDDSDEEPSFRSQSSNYSEDLDHLLGQTVEIDLSGGCASGVGASNSKIPQRPIIAGEESVDHGIKLSNHSEPYEQTLNLLPPHPQPKTHLHKPVNLFELAPGEYYESAMVFYNPNAPQRSQVYNWDNIKTFMQEMDKRAFDTRRSKKSIALGVLGFCAGCVSSTPETGTLVSSIGRFFNIPVGESLSTAIVVWTMVTTTPCFAMNMGNRFYIIGKTLFSNKAFPTRSIENASIPCVIETSKLHKAAIGILAFASFLDATINLGVVELAYYKHFQKIFFGTGGFYLSSWMAQYYGIGRANIDRLFCQYSHDTRVSHAKRLLLINSVKKCQQAIAKNDVFTAKLYDNILAQMEKKNTQNNDLEQGDSRHLFGLSALFLQAANTMNFETLEEQPDEEPDEETELLNANARLMNFQAQQDVPHAWKEEFLEKLSTILTGAGSIGRAVTAQYILDQVLTQVLSMPTSTAYEVAWALSIFDFLFRSFAEYNTQQQYMRGWLNSFSVKHLGDFSWLRKTISLSSIFNGGLFSLAKTVAGITAFNAWNTPIVVQALCLIPSFALDQGYFGTFFDKGNNSIITNIATIKQPTETAHINIKRAWLMKWSRKIVELLESQWDRDTIGNLYSTILKGF
ncbi:hypothetical protein IM40_05025 [Candidatus Paracaedimonas acanthamoebae]|nr:hypothetical protein IM40_05025 [Candidatus Paracaedimonas acanthamoebae]